MSERYNTSNDNDVYRDGHEEKYVPDHENREARFEGQASLPGSTSKNADVHTIDVATHYSVALRQDSDTERFPSHRSTSTSEVATGSTSSLNVPAARTLSSNSLQNSDNVKPPAPSSVKSYGSNMGSDDCGGSLDVEANSDDARSIDEIFPVAMPDQDLETAAVASLSITPAESGECLKFPVRYNSEDTSSSFTLQRFHRNTFGSHGDEYPVVTGTEAHLQLSHDDIQSREVVRNIDAADDYGTRGRIRPGWNDPRIDEPSSHETQRSSRILLATRKDPAKSTSRNRSRSRSRSPLTES